jgi:hypothetical protein
MRIVTLVDTAVEDRLRYESLSQKFPNHTGSVNKPRNATETELVWIPSRFSPTYALFKIGSVKRSSP